MTLFQPKGRMTRRDAALNVLRKRLTGDHSWISMKDLQFEMGELTGDVMTEESAKRGAYEACEFLMREGEMTVKWYQNGYQRKALDGQLAVIHERMVRVNGARERVVNATTVPLANSELTSEMRVKVEAVRYQNDRQSELDLKRLRKEAKRKELSS